MIRNHNLHGTFGSCNLPGYSQSGREPGSLPSSLDGRQLVQDHVTLVPYSVLPFATIHLNHTLGLRTPWSPIMSSHPPSSLRQTPRYQSGLPHLALHPMYPAVSYSLITHYPPSSSFGSRSMLPGGFNSISPLMHHIPPNRFLFSCPSAACTL